jgi:hypothetical protein
MCEKMVELIIDGLRTGGQPLMGRLATGVVRRDDGAQQRNRAVENAQD